MSLTSNCTALSKDRQNFSLSLDKNTDKQSTVYVPSPTTLTSHYWALSFQLHSEIIDPHLYCTNDNAGISTSTISNTLPSVTTVPFNLRSERISIEVIELFFNFIKCPSNGSSGFFHNVTEILQQDYIFVTIRCRTFANFGTFASKVIGLCTSFIESQITTYVDGKVSFRALLRFDWAVNVHERSK